VIKSGTWRGLRRGWSRGCSLAVLALLGTGAAAAASGPCLPSSTGESTLAALLQTTDNAPGASESALGSEARRARLLEQVRTSSLCFSPNSTPEQLARIAAMYDTLPPGMFVNGDRFFVDSTAWTGNSALGPSGRAVRTTLRYSFPADGVAWGNTTSGNNLNALIAARFGATNSDRGREYMRQALASWKRFSGLTYNEVSDNNGSFSFSTSAPAAGDIRIGSIPQDGIGGVLAYNVFPANGGDMTIDSDDLVTQSMWNTTNNYRFLRNVVSHEHGHGLGFIHSVPCNGTKLMEPFAGSNFDAVQIDEIRGVQRNHGDRFAGNTSAANARDFGNLTSPTVKSIIERNLSTNGVGGFGGSQEDWFRFTLGSAQNVVITAVPVGGTYTQGQQANGCNGTTAAVNASQAGNLDVELRDSAGTTVIIAANINAAGLTETVTAPNLGPGTYTVRVVDIGPNANQTLQLYDLTIRVGSSRATPFAVAGINKRIAAGQLCFFMGDLYSRANEAGATLNSASYDWDLDGNGVFETLDQPQPTFTYPSNMLVNVTLRVTDSNGMSSTDTIVVNVSGAISLITSISPSTGTLGATIPVTIVGSNLAGVNNASQVVVGGSGITVIGTPSVTAGGTTISGLSLVIAPNAVLGTRNINITNADGAGQNVALNNGFTINSTPPSNNECSSPISWGSVVGARPFTNTNATTGVTQGFPATGCPAAGSIFNDVWYTWTATATGSLGITTDSGSASPSFSSRVAVYQGTTCPPVSANLRGCDDFGVVFTITLTAGQTYLFQVGSAFASGTGTANVVLTFTPFQGACCDSAGFCTIEAAANCLGSSTYQGTGTICNPTPCIEPDGTCCAADGSCSFVARESCIGGTFAGGGACEPNPCAAAMGSCCVTDGACVVTVQTDCTTIWTMGALCDPNPCPALPTTGACCVETACSVTTQAMCSGAFQGAGSLCGEPGNPTTCCRANFNGIGGVTVQDIFDFLTAFFSNDLAADIDNSGAVSVQDIFDYIGAFFASCPG